MARLSESVVDDVVRCCLLAYEKLPKSGKPVEKEWTVLSCVVQREAASGALEVVAAGTGTKCAGAGALCARGAALADSHAEVVARRALLLHLLRNASAAVTPGDDARSSIFQLRNNTLVLKDNIEFIFYSSQLPCGDASIMAKNEAEENVGDIVKPVKRPAESEICDEPIKKLKEDDDIHRTGAKCLPDAEQDPKSSKTEYHLLGQVRTKPGRGDRTLSVSCSDKMARWIKVGIQGALLDMLCGPIFIKHFIFGAGVPYSEDSLRRALLNRDNNFMTEVVPEFYQSSIVFSHIRTDMNMRPAPGSIVWAKGNLCSEVAVRGKKLGLTKKKAVSAKNSLCISKYKLYESFISILQCNSDLKENVLKDSGGKGIQSVPYNEMKKRSARYIAKWREVKEKFFKIWTVKPDIWNFCLEPTVLYTPV